MSVNEPNMPVAPSGALWSRSSGWEMSRLLDPGLFDEKKLTQDLSEDKEVLIAQVRLARSGDAAAVRWLYRQFNTAMFRICLRMTGSSADAEDLLQEAFVRAFSQLGQLSDERRFGGWLRRIVVNECLGFARKHVRWRELEEGFDAPASAEEEAWWEGIPPETVGRIISGLPEGCRQVFHLYVMEDYTHREIAVALAISESTSKSQYQRARTLLQDRLTKEMNGNGPL